MNKTRFITHSRIVFVLLVVPFFMGSLAFHANAQMMGNNGDTSSANPTDIKNQQLDEATGKKLFDQFQNNQINCAKLTDTDFEKIGEYSMSQMFGNNTASHVAMNQRIQQMRGQTGEEQMHAEIGRSVTGCSTTSSQNNTPRGGGFNMMGNGGYGMMNGNFAWFGILGFIGWLVALVDLILVGIWLWKQIQRK